MTIYLSVIATITMWLEQNAVGLLGIGVGGFIGYHVYYLSKRIDLRGKLEHKSYVSQQVEPLLAAMARGNARKIELVNARRYPKHYLGQNEQNRHGYAYLGAELKALRFDGVEFFCEIVGLYQEHDGHLTLTESPSATRLTSSAFVVGVVPYEWIEFVEPRGDEFSYRPQFFTQFKGLEKSPYKYLRYYKKSETYEPGNDPADMQWTTIEPRLT